MFVKAARFVVGEQFTCRPGVDGQAYGKSSLVRMKTCNYCGKENEDDATRCVECGTELVVAPPNSEAPAPWDKIATIETEVEAERLDVDLSSRNIPHVMVSYNETAFEGVFQATRGWGYVEGPAEHKEAILTVLKDIRESGAKSEDAPDAPI